MRVAAEIVDDVTIVFNPKWESGLASSLATGLEVAQAMSCDAALVMTTDQPLIDSAKLKALISAFDAEHRIVASSYDDIVGVPAVFGAEYFDSLMKLRGDESSVRERSVIERQVKHVVRLVDDLLDASRITRGKVRLEKRSVEIADVIRDAIEISSPLLELRKHRLVVEVPPRGLTLEGDPFRLAQVFSNLITNAAKFTNPGGTITISAVTEAGEMVVRVRDTGIGIDPALLPRAFDAFAQGVQASDRAQGGLGLGLTIVKSMVVLHGGQVEAHSAGAGRGCEFVIRLPMMESRARNASPLALERPSPQKSQGLRVLVVDDNEDAAMLLCEVLRFDGHEVVIAHDGASALQASLTFVPDVALLDIGLPVMDGYELAVHLRARYTSPALRLIAITGYGEDKDRARSRVAGFDEHLVKPVDIDRVRQLVATRHGDASTEGPRTAP